MSRCRRWCGVNGVPTRRRSLYPFLQDGLVVATEFDPLHTGDRDRPARVAVADVMVSAGPVTLTRTLAAVASSFVVVHVVLQIIRFATDNDGLFGLVKAFSLGSDTGIPAYYSAIIILFCAVLASVIATGTARRSEPDLIHWIGLAVIFVFLSLDEMLAYHEQLAEPTRDALNTSGILFYAWVIPYGAAGLAFLAAYVPFLRRLPSRTSKLFLLAGVVYVSGAIGIEMVGGNVFESEGSRNVSFVALQTVEECLEMAGIIIFVFALAEHAVERFGRLGVAIADEG